MSTDYRALCAELADALERASCGLNNHTAQPGHRSSWAHEAFQSVAKARAYLATPEPAPGPTNEELEQLWQAWELPEYEALSKQDTINQLRAVLARWGRTTPHPIPVFERLPGPEDCDGDGCIWLWVPDLNGHVGLGHWERQHRDWATDPDGDATHWLPYHALPLPGG